jgi:hypothetical protein
MYFRFGSLVAVSPAWPTVYIPIDVTNPGAGWKAIDATNSAETPWETATIAGIPYNQNTYPSGTQYHHVGYKFSTEYIGDVCRFITDAGRAPEAPKGWRLPTGKDCTAFAAGKTRISEPKTPAPEEPVADGTLPISTGHTSTEGVFIPDAENVSATSGLVNISSGYFAKMNLCSASAVEDNTYNTFNGSLLSKPARTATYSVRCVKN